MLSYYNFCDCIKINTTFFEGNKQFSTKQNCIVIDLSAYQTIESQIIIVQTLFSTFGTVIFNLTLNRMLELIKNQVFGNYLTYIVLIKVIEKNNFQLVGELKVCVNIEDFQFEGESFDILFYK